MSTIIFAYSALAISSPPSPLGQDEHITVPTSQEVGFRPIYYRGLSTEFGAGTLILRHQQPLRTPQWISVGDYHPSAD
ncbi:unnamed protein product [Penicillium camemberti]|uniref:Str. FM013 n=1 Tax=Penicillium camemberti (strain FM 013) TaxID=1429867 RepID=A0A0G4PMU1_PENC3|nr:unnamed protein product [Penicillium camemberti]